MYKITAVIDGMMCKNCEAHMTEAVKKSFSDATKIVASHKTGTCEFFAENEIDEEILKKAATDLGYEYVSYECEAV